MSNHDRIYNIVKQYIDEYDFKNLLSHCPDDEYDSESAEIAGRITEDSSVFDIAYVIADVFDRSFSDDSIERNDDIDIDCYIDAAEMIKLDISEFLSD